MNTCFRLDTRCHRAGNGNVKEWVLSRSKFAYCKLGTGWDTSILFGNSETTEYSERRASSMPMCRCIEFSYNHLCCFLFVFRLQNSPQAQIFSYFFRSCDISYISIASFSRNRLLPRAHRTMKIEKWNSIKTAKWMKTWLVVAVGLETDALHWQRKYYFLFEFQLKADAVKILKYFWFDFQCVRCVLWLFVSTSMGASLAFNPIFPTKEFESYRKNWNWINVRSKKKLKTLFRRVLLFSPSYGAHVNQGADALTCTDHNEEKSEAIAQLLVEIIP